MNGTEERLAEMDSALARIRQLGDVKGLESDSVSYSLLPADLSVAGVRLRTLLNECVRLAGAESFIQSGDRAVSALVWWGDLATVWAGSIAPEQAKAHIALLDADLRYRYGMVRICIASVQAAATLCAAAASPLMAPAAFRSMTNLVSELQRFALVAVSHQTDQF